MVKKQSITNKTQKQSSLKKDTAKINTQTKPKNIPKQTVIINSKLKKKLKSTFKKLQLHEGNLVNSIKAIKIKDGDSNSYENIYLYILLKNNQNLSEEKEEEFSENLKKLKNKMIKLPNNLSNEINQLKTALIVEDEKEVIGLEETLELSAKDEETFEIHTLKDFTQLINSLKTEKNSQVYLDELNQSYRLIIASDKLKNRLNQILKIKNSSKAKQTATIETVFYNGNKQKSTITEFLQNLISLSSNSSVLQVVKRNCFKIKIANSSMKPSEIYKNIKLTVYRIVSLILASMNKYTAVKAVVVKSESSMPFEIYEKIDEDDLELF